MKRFVVLLFIVVPAIDGYAQELGNDSTKNDVDAAVIDSVGFYGDLYQYSKDRKFLFLVYQMIFNVSDYLGKQDLTLGDIDSISYNYLEGRKIGSIKIINYGPFGNAVTDTTPQKKSTIEQIGNRLHFKTKQAIIRNNLLFNEGDPLDLLRISESERLVRSSQYIRDARIKLIDRDTVVDIEVYTLDLWTFRLGLSLTGSKVIVSFTGYNMFGVGHRFRNKTTIRYKNIDNNQFENEGSYLVPNIGSTFISSELIYKFTNSEEFKGISLQRKFYSALTKYAGGFEFLNRFVSDSVRLRFDGYDTFDSKANYTGIWAGRSFKLRKGSTVEERGSKFVVSAGYSQLRYKKLETESELVKQYFQPYELYLMEFGFSNRKYYTDRFVLKFGEREDIPTGRILKFTTGYEHKKNEGEYYAGVTAGGSGFFQNQSYLSLTAGYGSYLNSGMLADGVFKTDLLYFSRLYGRAEWKLRWFVEGNFTTGIRRDFNEFIKLKEGDWIPGYNKEQPEGNTRLALNFTVVVFNPFDWIGFKFTPVVFGGFGMTSIDVSDLKRVRTYPGFGGGVAINNVYLVQSEIRLFFGYYHNAPGSDVRFSSFEAWEFEFTDYDFDKPETIRFE